MIPEIQDRRWDNLVLNRGTFQFHLLSVKILMSRVYVNIKKDPSDENIAKCKREVYEFFVKNEKISQKDLLQIFNVEKS